MPTQPQRKPAIEETPSTQTLQYWMGRVDANITELKNAFSDFVEKSDDSWADFTAWRRGVDERLQAGNAKFDDHHKRIEKLEGAKGNGAKSESDEPKKEPSGFGSWGWFRDGYLEKAVTIIITLSLYKLIELIIQNWNTLP